MCEAPGKLTSCEDYFASRFEHLEEKFSYIGSLKEVKVKNDHRS